MSGPASTLLAPGLRPTDPAPAKRAESTAPLAWEVRPERVSVQTADGSELRDLHAVYIEGDRRGYQPTRAEAEEVARTLANDPAPDWLVTVCAACLCASCWHGELLCGSARTAGTTERRASELSRLGHEHPSRYSRARLFEVCGTVTDANDPAPSTFGTAPDASIPSAVDALARARHAIERDAHSGLVSALREQILTWQRASIEYASRAEWARDPAAASMQAHAARLSACAADLEALLAGHTGTLPDDDDEVLADSPAPGLEVAR